MRAGRWTGAAAGHRLALRVEAIPAGVRVSGDLAETPAGGAESYLGSFVFDGAVPSSSLQTLRGGAAERALGLRLDPLGDAAARVALELHPPAGAAGTPLRVSLDVALEGPGQRALRIRSAHTPGLPSPDDAARAGAERAGSRISVAGALAAAGVDVRFEAPAAVDPAAAGDAVWRRGEIDAALRTLSAGAAPGAALGGAWSVPLLLVPRFERPGVVGVTLPRSDGEPRGAAVFPREIPSHAAVGGDPSRQARELLFAIVHELGHVLGLPHAWERLAGTFRGHDALSFMNYPDLFPFGYTGFYERFAFTFTADELAHLRHAPWSAIRPGRPGQADLLELRRVRGLELVLRSPRGARIPLGEPVMLEAKLANTRASRARVPRAALDLESGLLRVFVARAGGPPRRFRPLVEAWARGGRRTLGVRDVDLRLPDARYASVDLSFGRDGFPFAEVGHYEVYAQALLPPSGGVQSDPLRFEIVAAPPGAEAARLVGDRALGRALALGADPASEAAAALRSLAEGAAGPGVAALADARLALAEEIPWKRLAGPAAAADPREAADRFERAAETATRTGALPNRAISALMRGRLRARLRAGEGAAARDAEADWLRFVGDRVQENGVLRKALLREIHEEGARLRRALS